MYTYLCVFDFGILKQRILRFLWVLYVPNLCVIYICKIKFEYWHNWLHIIRSLLTARTMPLQAFLERLPQILNGMCAMFGAAWFLLCNNTHNRLCRSFSLWWVISVEAKWKESAGLRLHILARLYRCHICTTRAWSMAINENTFKWNFYFELFKITKV